MKIKIGKAIFDITDEDTVKEENGKYFILSKRYLTDRGWKLPPLSKKQFAKFYSKGALKLTSCAVTHVDAKGKKHFVAIYNFCIENIKTKKKESSKNENENRTQNI